MRREEKIKIVQEPIKLDDIQVYDIIKIVNMKKKEEKEANSRKKSKYHIEDKYKIGKEASLDEIIMND
ncbi:hypothetical protein PFDG_05183 [Plasmodium falciparum Dd2]|uniref:Uncharacterized protein n=1 Tax=Plasmodium falciparum (isolate Dd2) TaxID=57267 RepID=A0A0L7M9U7_PLAF4|nr:hypothetical protein PFDG_05183 [Plasmodium falciparum Dd2]